MVELEIDRLNDELENGEKSLILSGEALSGWRFPSEAIEPTVLDFAQHFDEVVGIAYIREPVSYIRSSMQQHVKRFPGRFDLNFHYPHYKRRLGCWVAVLSEWDLQLVPFSREYFHNQDLISDFELRVGAERSVKRRNIENSSLSAEAFSLMWKYHKDLGSRYTKDEKLLLMKRAEYLLMDYGSRNFEISE